VIIWVDTETSGLDPRNGHLLEVALVVTDDELNELGHVSSLVLPVGITIKEMARDLDPVVLEMHTKNGLLDELLAATRGELFRRYAVEEYLLAFLAKHSVSGLSIHESFKRVPLAGSTVGFDRAWLKEHMPKFESMVSYRSIDVSSITELAKRWAPSVYEGRPKADPSSIAHRALADVRESIEILKYYCRCGFLGVA